MNTSVGSQRERINKIQNESSSTTITQSIETIGIFHYMLSAQELNAELRVMSI